MAAARGCTVLDGDWVGDFRLGRSRGWSCIKLSGCELKEDGKLATVEAQ
jgi:hypothetical protein